MFYDRVKRKTPRMDENRFGDIPDSTNDVRHSRVLFVFTSQLTVIYRSTRSISREFYDSMHHFSSKLLRWKRWNESRSIQVFVLCSIHRFNHVSYHDFGIKSKSPISGRRWNETRRPLNSSLLSSLNQIKWKKS